MKSTHHRFVWPYLIFALFATTIFSYGCAQKKGPLYIVGFDPLWQPLNFEQNQGKINTFIPAKLLQIADLQKFRVDFISTDSAQLFSGLENERYDAILSTINNDEQAARFYDFSDPILQIGPVVIVASDSNIRNINELKGKIIAVSPYSNDASLIVQKLPSAIIRPYENKTVVLEELLSHRVDAVMMNAIDAQQLTSTLFKDKVIIITSPLTEQAIRLLVLKDKHTTFLHHFNQGLKEFKS